MPALDRMTELEAEEADPAAADGRAGAGRHDHLRLIVEQPEQVRAGHRHPHGARAQQRTAARPGTDQRERALLAAQHARGVGGRRVGVERLAEQGCAHAAHPNRVRSEVSAAAEVAAAAEVSPAAEVPAPVAAAEVAPAAVAATAVVAVRHRRRPGAS
jgi:hypothetical protein